MLEKRKKETQLRNDDKRYATVADDEGENYREIAAVMTEMGYAMNHSSARNYVIRVMKKFVEAYVTEYSPTSMTDEQVEAIAKDSKFQTSMADILHIAETDRRKRMSLHRDSYDDHA